MLTTREGGAAARAPKCAEDVGVNDLGDGGAAMCVLRRSQLWEGVIGSVSGLQDRALARINTIDALTFPSLGEKNNGRSRSGFS